VSGGDEPASLSVVTVTHDARDALARTLPALTRELRQGDELIVVDNASGDGTPAVVRELAPEARLIESGANLGFAAACNIGAEAASGELLVLLNPDAVPAEGFRDAIERPLHGRRGWGAWMGLVTASSGEIVNTAGGAVHFTGVAWAGGAGLPRESAPSAPAEVGFLSGACLAMPLARWRDLGGLPEAFFLYHEDVDISLRLRLRGEAIGIEPEAVVDHDYEFEKGPEKWKRLERNRWAVLVRNYPAGLLALIAPALIATELAILVAAIGGGWGRQKLTAWAGTLSDLRRLLRERGAIQATRRVSAGEFARGLVAELDSPYLGRIVRSGPIRWALRGYWAVVLTLLRAR
jgi:GT2 family glycosyltransferase